MVRGAEDDSGYGSAEAKRSGVQYASTCATVCCVLCVRTSVLAAAAGAAGALGSAGAAATPIAATTAMRTGVPSNPAHTAPRGVSFLFPFT